MTEAAQEALFDVPAEPKKRTDRQELVLQAVQRAGIDGIDAADAGAILCARRGRHSADDRCQWDGMNGKGVLEELRAKGLVVYRRAKGSLPGAWITAGEIPDDGRMPPGMTDEIPY